MHDIRPAWHYWQQAAGDSMQSLDQMVRLWLSDERTIKSNKSLGIVRMLPAGESGRAATHSTPDKQQAASYHHPLPPPLGPHAAKP
jgi:hypothetical protein